jgi:hypothetical protein
MKKPEIIVRIPHSLHCKIMNDLTSLHSFATERIGFVASKYKVLKSGTIIVFIIDYYPIKDEFYINDPEVGARINSDAIREALQKIIDNKVGLFHAHCHSFANYYPDFSSTDLEDNPEIIRSFGYADKNQIHGMFVFSPNGINALLKLPGGKELISPTKIIVVGYPMIISTPEITKRKIHSKRYERQSFLGRQSEFIISQFKIGIVGLGGGGSHIVQQLAYLGFKNYVLFDYDKVDETNLNRMIGASLEDVKKETKKVDIAERIIKHLHSDASIRKVEDNWMNKPEFLQECDIVIGCVDSYIGRRDLELECRRYLLPYIDIGMDVHHTFKKEAPSLVGQIILSMPGELCMTCLGFLTEDNLEKEAAKYGNAGGRPQVVWSNGVLASQAIGIIVDLVTGWSGKKEITQYYAFDGNSGVLINHPRLKYISGNCHHFSIEQTGIPIFRKMIPKHR